MAVVKAPLLSLGASGTIGGALVFATWKGRAYVRKHAVPSNPRSGGQLSSRAMLQFLSQYWTNLSSVQKADWDTRAAVTNISPFNAFVAYNMQRWATNNRPSKLDPAGLVNTAGVSSAFTATPGLKSVTIGYTVGTLNDNWGVMIFRGLTAAMGVTRAEMVHIIVAESAAGFTWLDVALTTGTPYYYRAYPFSDDGVIGAAEDDITATPT